MKPPPGLFAQLDRQIMRCGCHQHEGSQSGLVRNEYGVVILSSITDERRNARDDYILAANTLDLDVR